jgi:acyl carrier protein
MIPSAIVRLDAMPLTANGKVDRSRLPAPERATAAEYVAPRTPGEAAIARVWSDVLQADRVGVFDNFFELGGHSLLATRVIAHLRDELQVDVPLRALFAEPTVAGFAAEVERMRALGAHTGPAIQSVPRSATRIRT